jgi:SAM-dependent methyltransferase
MSSTGQSPRSTSNFDTIADEQYDESIPSHVMGHLTERRVATIHAAAQSGTVLDVGCGTGRLLGALDGSRYDRYGLDVSIGMVQQALRKDEQLRCALASGTAIPFADNSFDVVFCAAVLHHIAEPAAVAQAIREIIRVTKLGGTAIIWDHNPLNPYWPILMSRVPQDIGEERLISRAEIGATLSALQREWSLTIKWRQLTFIPDFVPVWSMPVLKPIERICEQIPLLQRISAHNVAIVTKRS